MASDYTAGLPSKRMGAGVLFRNAAGDVLLVEPTYTDHWEIPGGTVEADESPRAAAVREVVEELGLATSPGRLLVVDWVPPRAGRTEGLMLIFDGGRLTGEQTASIRVPPAELRGWAWSAPAEVDRRLPGRLARRVAAARAAVDGGGTVYLEGGRPASGSEVERRKMS
jgi:8-oxo-dGTP pyrophosphatase MutT (NUDIX family)